MKKTDKEFDKRILKKNGEELQGFLSMKKRHGVVQSKKGKGSYNRRKFKKFED